jgi:hypothetical protein
MELDNNNISQAIIQSQHCQRNWDLTKEIPQDDIDLLITAATECPSKQNVAFYAIHAITNRDIINAIYNTTDGFTISRVPHRTVMNSQTLANLLFVVEPIPINTLDKEAFRNDQTLVSSRGVSDPMAERLLERDRNMAIGIATGYINLTANILGYNTGYCACFDDTVVKNLLNLKNFPTLLLGVGFNTPGLDRKLHQLDHSFVYPVNVKQKIQVTQWK